MGLYDAPEQGQEEGAQRESLHVLALLVLSLCYGPCHISQMQPKE